MTCTRIILGWAALCVVAACSPPSSSYSVAPQTPPNAALHMSKAPAKPKFKEYVVPTAQSEPYKMVLGPDGKYWFTEFAGNKVADITTAGKFSEFDVPSAQAEPSGITVGPDDNLWFTEAHADKIAKLTTAGKFTEYKVATVSADPSVIRSGGGSVLWFSERGGNKIGEITTSGKITEFTVPTPDSGRLRQGTFTQHGAKGHAAELPQGRQPNRREEMGTASTWLNHAKRGRVSLRATTVRAAMSRLSGQRIRNHE